MNYFWTNILWMAIFAVATPIAGAKENVHSLASTTTHNKTNKTGGLRGGPKKNSTRGHHPSHNSSNVTGDAVQLFEGDIVPDYEFILTEYGPDVVQELEKQGMLNPGEDPRNVTSRQADVNRRWTTRVNGIVQIPYSFAGQHSSSAIAIIETALRDLGTRSSVVRFVPRTSENDYISIISGSGCWSWVGRQGGKQEVSLKSDGCITNGIVQHEFLHALGFEHEQSRPDRDSFVRINFENIQPGNAHNFDKRTNSDSLGSPYDYGSVMHYGKADFSVNGRDTITAPAAIGQRDRADEEDIRQVRLLYQCVSKARSLTSFIASPCSSDCKCWEGASGCNGNSAACQAGLVCNSSNQCVRSSSSRTFRSFHRTYLSAPANSNVKLVSQIQSSESFTVSSAGSGKVFIRTVNGSYLSAWPDGLVRLASHALSWEQWTQVQNSDGSISLLSFHGTYLSGWTDGTVRLMPHNQAWEHWF